MPNRRTYRVEVVVLEQPKSVGPFTLVDYVDPDAEFRVMAHNHQQAADLVVSYLIHNLDTDQLFVITGGKAVGYTPKFFRINSDLGKAVEGESE